VKNTVGKQDNLDFWGKEKKRQTHNNNNEKKKKKKKKNSSDFWKSDCPKVNRTCWSTRRR